MPDTLEEFLERSAKTPIRLLTVSLLAMALGTGSLVYEAHRLQASEAEAKRQLAISQNVAQKPIEPRDEQKLPVDKTEEEKPTKENKPEVEKPTAETPRIPDIKVATTWKPIRVDYLPNGSGDLVYTDSDDGKEKTTRIPISGFPKPSDDIAKLAAQIDQVKKEKDALTAKYEAELADAERKQKELRDINAKLAEENERLKERIRSGGRPGTSGSAAQAAAQGWAQIGYVHGKDGTGRATLEKNPFDLQDLPLGKVQGNTFVLRSPVSLTDRPGGNERGGISAGTKVRVEKVQTDGEAVYAYIIPIQ
jgi:hypothetical protein